MILFAFPEQAALTNTIGLEQGDWQWQHFPDGESYVRVVSDVKGKETTILCSLNQPDAKALPLMFLARTLRELDVTRITLIAPYLGYMRQDKRFQKGEAVTSEIFASLLSHYIDALVTIDPHLHRYHRMEEIYDCECTVLSTAPLMTQWIKQNITKPLIIGPDAESEQWVKEVAVSANAPYIILQKTRHSDREVEITLPDIAAYHNRLPVLVDDIISTAGTMIKTVGLLKAQGFAEIACLATHGLFAGDAYKKLQQAGARRVVTANTVLHPSNRLDIVPLLKPTGK